MHTSDGCRKTHVTEPEQMLFNEMHRDSLQDKRTLYTRGGTIYCGTNAQILTDVDTKKSETFDSTAVPPK